MAKHEKLLSGLSKSLRHVVLIPDGNGRWAHQRGLPTLSGHEKGVEAIEKFLKVCRDFEIEIATVWAFSTENWNRDPDEVAGIMGLIEMMLTDNCESFAKEGVRVVQLGRKDRIAKRYPQLAGLIRKVEKETRPHSAQTLNLALDYGGRDEMLRAIQEIMGEQVSPDEIDEDLLLAHLDTAGQPDPDLIIRTSGESRLSGILPFQSVYSELYFCPLLLPDLTEEAVQDAFRDFAERKRRFGRRSQAEAIGNEALNPEGMMKERSDSNFRNLKSFIGNYLQIAEASWERYWANRLSNLDKVLLEPRLKPALMWEKQFATHYREMMRGGKHLRGALVVLGWRISGRPADHTIAMASGALELLHNAFLVHDDVVDKSEMRRNSPTIHKIYKDIALNRGAHPKKAREVGFGMALNLGDVGQAFAQDLLIDAGFPIERAMEGISLFNTNVKNTVLGQVLDLEDIPLRNLTEDYVITIHEYKTSYYTIVFPLVLGLTLGGGASTQLKEALIRYGVSVGIAFQLQDDLLGLFGDEGTVGKPVDSDLKEGKKTLLFVKAYEFADGPSKRRLVAAHGNSEATPEDLQFVRQLVKESGALDYSNRLAQKLVEDAKQAVANLGVEDDVKDLLDSVADFVISRSK